jgi:hypothetical protein
MVLGLDSVFFEDRSRTVEINIQVVFRAAVLKLLLSVEECRLTLDLSRLNEERCTRVFR